MNFLHRVFLSMYIVLNLFSYADAEAIPSGYEKVDWSSSVESVRLKYPKGQLSKLADEVIYRQFKPNQQVGRRNFAFKNGRLHTVSIALEKQYVEKHGIEKLFQEYVKRYGEGVMDSSQAPHMISYLWSGVGTKISFSYAPKRPDMTVIIFESVDKAVGTVNN